MTTSENKSLYADGIGKIRSENGVIKIDLVMINDHPSKEGEQSRKIPETISTLVFSPEGFKQATKTMRKMRKSLKKNQPANPKQEG
ncbi:hypothetical protein [Sneathiella sp.]|jgi:hypothetical protein|uniref:hypothetical protein n=1 Tax=Sneathiella sp. TaxID=1964365 RepID=UPI0039E2E967